VSVTDRGDARIGVSMAGAGGVVVVAAASVAIGVDHEPRGAAHRAVADVALTESERTQLAELPVDDQPDGLLRWWVRKEAVLKMTGHGLLADPSRLSVSPPDAPPRLLRWDGPGPRPVAQMADLDIDGFVAALAVRTHEPLRVGLEPASFSRTTS
jgi:4'-phosphopantetheinyl transferase